ncbi:MAG: 2-oxoglutarate dehydrogenase E1 component [Myxococcota bacterium]
MSEQRNEEGLSGVSEADLAAIMSGENGAFVESLFEDYITGRQAVPENWIRLFDALTGRNGGNGRTSAPALLNYEPRGVGEDLPGSPTGVFGLVNAFRSHGHLIARLDPLGRGDTTHSLLDPAEFGLDRRLDERLGVGNFLGLGDVTTRELLQSLHETYCDTFAAEFMEIADKERRDWLVERMEPCRNHPRLSPEEQRAIYTKLCAAERFEQFLHKRFLGQKRFSLEGGEALIPMLNAIVDDAAELGAEEIVVAMAHRGRLNVLAHTLGMPYRAIFADFQPSLIPLDAQGSGDVKYHRGYSADRKTRTGREIHLSLCPNPSHLEWINPVAEGMVRAKQNIRGDVERMRVVPIQIHGDAAFTGQGVVAETLALSELAHYWTGGTIHVIVNNQIGFTTDPEDYRFTRHPSDMAKVIQAPILHVNADDPEACLHAARLAIAFRQRFREDVIIDLVCYRRHGHNEGDDPTFTQPLLYKKINAHPRVGTLYGERLMREGSLDREALEQIERAQKEVLEQEMEASRISFRLAGAEGYHGLWSRFEAQRPHENGRTAITVEVAGKVAEALLSFPPGFHPHPKVRRLMEQRAEALRGEAPIDWGAGEALAFGSLLVEGVTIRLTGQDSERGTFTHRHAVLHDVENGSRLIPLEKLGTEDARFIIGNSLLSEAAVLGFEYGYSSVDPQRLVIWEAQFGDFANSAQVIVDQFISSAEQKWNRSSGLVMLLPHGYEGQGPEHSSARLERFLQLCAEDNLQICNLTTPAQLFHALRRQLRRNYRKPLVIMSPKSLLRHPRAVSRIEAFVEGGFREVLDDPRRVAGTLDPASVRRVLLCSGKVYYTLLAAQEDSAFDDVAIVRLEEIHPFPFERLEAALADYATRDFVWVQEEPWNQGAWFFVRERLGSILARGARVRYVGRPESASPATGSYRRHVEEEQDFVSEAFARRARRRKS